MIVLVLFKKWSIEEREVMDRKRSFFLSHQTAVFLQPQVEVWSYVISHIVDHNFFTWNLSLAAELISSQHHLALLLFLSSSLLGSLKK